MGSKAHMVVFPFMAQGHTIPLLDLSKALARRGIKVTIITTPSNASSIKPYIISRHYSSIHIREIPFPKTQGFPDGCENMSQTSSPDHLLAFLNATKLLRDPFEATLKEMCRFDRQDRPTCVISDSFLGWTNATCCSLGVPRMVFNGMGVFAMAVKKALSIHQTHKCAKNDSDIVDVKGVEFSFDLFRRDLPSSLKVMNSEISDFFLEAERSDLGSFGVIANSFVELERDYVLPLESLYGNHTRTFCVGPLFLYEQMEEIGPDGPQPSATYADWLNRRGEEKSVLYVSFGSQANLCDEQLDELAYGLELSGEDYIWVIRSKTWKNPTNVNTGGTKGLIVREWVDQKWILAHWALGGFVSHCGWNSVLESLASGVPILGWPMQAEQHLNAKFLVEELKVGIGLEREAAQYGKFVGREEIRRGIKELMRGESGRQAKENAAELGRIAKRAVQIGGSSYKCLDELIERLANEKTGVDPV